MPRWFYAELSSGAIVAAAALKRSRASWNLSGDCVDPNEIPCEAVERVVMKESGNEVLVEKLLAIFDRSR